MEVQGWIDMIWRVSITDTIGAVSRHKSNFNICARNTNHLAYDGSEAVRRIRGALSAL